MVCLTPADGLISVRVRYRTPDIGPGRLSGTAYRGIGKFLIEPPRPAVRFCTG